MKKHKLQISEKKNRTIFEIVSDVVVAIIIIYILSLIIFNYSNTTATIILIMSSGYIYFKIIKRE